MVIKPGKVFTLYSRFKSGMNSKYIYCGIVVINRRRYRLLFNLETRRYWPVTSDWTDNHKGRIVWKEGHSALAEKHRKRFEEYSEERKIIILKHLTPPKDRERLGIK